MKKMHYKCENCGADLIIDAKADSGQCRYCGANYYIDRQKPTQVHHYIGNIKITPARIVAAISAVAVLAAAIVIISLYFAGVFGNRKPPVSDDYRHQKAYLFEGTYLVGEDMEEGEFVAFKNPAKASGRILILKDKNASAGTSACIADYKFAENYYFTVKKGQYVKVVDSNVFRVGDKTVAAMADGSYEGNIVLRGGSDIPAGNYILHNEDKTMQYSDIKCVVGGVLYVKKIGYRSHLTIGEGDYVYLTRGKLYAENDAPKPVKGERDEYLYGQYKVGVDIEAGRYKFDYGNAGNVAFFAVNKNGFAFFDESQEINPTTTHGYVDLEDGDYIYLYMIKLLPQEENE